MLSDIDEQRAGNWPASGCRLGARATYVPARSLHGEVLLLWRYLKDIAGVVEDAFGRLAAQVTAFDLRLRRHRKGKSLQRKYISGQRGFHPRPPASTTQHSGTRST